MTLNRSGMPEKEGDGGITDSSGGGILNGACSARHASQAVKGVRAAENGGYRTLASCWNPDILLV